MNTDFHISDLHVEQEAAIIEDFFSANQSFRKVFSVVLIG